MEESSCVIKLKVAFVKKNRAVICRLVIVFCLLVFGFLACKKNQRIIDLAQEQGFAQKLGMCLSMNTWREKSMIGADGAGRS